MLFCYFVMVLSSLVLTKAEHRFKGKHLPNYIIPCSRSSPNLNACALEHGRQAIPTILKGDKEFKIPRLAPLQLDKIKVMPSDSLEITLTNLTLHGLEQLELKEVKIDEEQRHIDVILEGDNLRLLSNYKVKGHILGEGDANFKMYKCSIKYSLDYDVIEKSDGQTYGVFRKSALTFKVKRAKFYLDNLFDVDQELSDDMNKLLNENYQDVLHDLSEPLSQVIQSIASSLTSSFLGSTPYEEIFLP